MFGWLRNNQKKKKKKTLTQLVALNFNLTRDLRRDLKYGTRSSLFYLERESISSLRFFLSYSNSLPGLQFLNEVTINLYTLRFIIFNLNHEMDLFQR